MSDAVRWRHFFESPDRLAVEFARLLTEQMRNSSGGAYKISTSHGRENVRSVALRRGVQMANKVIDLAQAASVEEFSGRFSYLRASVETAGEKFRRGRGKPEHVLEYDESIQALFDMAQIKEIW